MSGLALPFPKYKFPEEFQQSSRLTYYSSLFRSIEINSSFYALPQKKTIARWLTEVPEHFRFTFKLWKQITHVKALDFQELDVKNFMDTIESAATKKGCLVIQFPASLKAEHIHQLDHLLHVIQTHNIDHAWKVAIEFRDSSWYSEDTYDLVDSYNATIVMHDKSRGASPHITTGADAIYLRFHGPQGDYRGSYSDAFLNEYAAYVQEWLAQGKSVFVYFNNTMGAAFENLKKLNHYIDAACSSLRIE